MTDSLAAPRAGATLWTCPFCPLLCDHLGVRAEGNALVLEGGECARSRAGLAALAPAGSAASPRVDGRAASLADAIAAAARLLAGARQPLFGGLGTDVAGARALYRLACATGAIADAQQGEALFHGLRAQQDRGGFTATFAEVRARADLIVFIGTPPLALAPLLPERLGLGDTASVAQRRIVVIAADGADGDAAVQQIAARPGVTLETIAPVGDVFETSALLAALVDRRRVDAPAALAALADALHAARYAVIVGTPAQWPAHGSLVVETIVRIVNTLNQGTRAAALWIGGGNGASTANQTFTWLSGLPLRSRAGPRGLEHEPVAHGAAALLADRAVDALLWVASFDAAARPPATDLPLIVLGHPALADSCDRPGSVFVPVGMPGIDAAGHLFRSDGVVLMPLFAARASTLPSLADVVGRIDGALSR